MHTTIEGLLEGIVAAWDAGSPREYAACFSPDASYVTYGGTVSRGRKEIERDHVPVLGRYQKGSRMRMRVLSLRHVGDGVAVVVTEGGVGRGRRVRRDKMQTLVMVRGEDGGWLCSAFQNSRRSPLMLWLVERDRRRG